MRRTIATVIGSRANYASIKSVLKELSRRPDVELELYVGAGALLSKYGNVADIIQSDGFTVTERFYMLVEGETPETMAMSTGLGIIRLAGIFQNRRPDLVISVGDRFETMATAVSAVYLNIRVAHTMGGEVTGTIDESVRHAVTKLAHLHFPANERAAARIIAMGENPAHVFVTGCPRIDVVAELIQENRNGRGIDEEDLWRRYKGVGGIFSLERERFLLVMQHPVTTEYGANRAHMHETLLALQELHMPTIMLWPNADAGSEEIAKEIRTFRERERPGDWLHLFTNLPMEVFIKLMDRCACMIGNSSSPIREGALVGVPAVNIGTRQAGRCRGRNVVDVDYDRQQIAAAIRSQVAHGKYDSDPIYGDGKAGPRIAEILGTIALEGIDLQKRIRI